MKEDDMKMPRCHIREKVMEIENHNGSGFPPVPKSHDDHLGVQHLARKHYPEPNMNIRSRG
jgi:hypothetical protein